MEWHKKEAKPQDTAFPTAVKGEVQCLTRPQISQMVDRPRTMKEVGPTTFAGTKISLVDDTPALLSMPCPLYLVVSFDIQVLPCISQR